MLLLLAGCGTEQSSTPSASQVARSSENGWLIRPLSDGAPWWEVDVSGIPDAIPVLHTGKYKANPYTLAGKTYYPITDGHNYREEGLASWYGTKFHGLSTANGEVYDLYGMTAAHKTLPLPTYVKVTNLENDREVILRVNDRGPFHSDRIIDLSFAAAKKLGFAETGTARVRVEGINPLLWQKQQSTVVSIPADEKRVGNAEQPSLPENAYYLQLGAFSNPDAAVLLTKRVKQKITAPAFISEAVRDKQTLYRVRVGPLGTVDEMRAVRQQIREAGFGSAIPVSAD